MQMALNDDDWLIWDIVEKPRFLSLESVIRIQSQGYRGLVSLMCLYDMELKVPRPFDTSCDAKGSKLYS